MAASSSPVIVPIDNRLDNRLHNLPKVMPLPLQAYLTNEEFLQLCREIDIFMQTAKRRVYASLALGSLLSLLLGFLVFPPMGFFTFFITMLVSMKCHEQNFDDSLPASDAIVTSLLLDRLA